MIDGGAERWQHISANRTSNEKLIVLLNEFTGGGNDEEAGGTPAQINLMPDQLPARGEGDQVPFHLRSSKSMKNRRLTRRDVAVLIQEIWTERRLSDRQVESPLACTPRARPSRTTLERSNENALGIHLRILPQSSRQSQHGSRDVLQSGLRMQTVHVQRELSVVPSDSLGRSACADGSIVELSSVLDR